MVVELLFPYALIFYQPVLGVSPEALYPVDVVARVAPLDELVLPVADAVVVAVAPVDKAVVGLEAVGVHGRGLVHLALDDLHQRPPGHVGDDLGVDLPASLQKAEHDGLAPGASAPHAPNAPRSEVALVRLHLPLERAVRLAGLGYPAAQHAVVPVHGVAVQARQLGGSERRHVGAEEPQQLPELTLREVRFCDVLILRLLSAGHSLIL